MKRHALILIAALLAAASCGDDHGSEPGPFDLSYPPTPVDLTVTPGTGQATIRWSYPPGDRDPIERFKLYYYIEVYDQVELIATISDTVYVDQQLVGNLEYCYRVSAVDTSGVEGYRSESACAVIGMN